MPSQTFPNKTQLRAFSHHALCFIMGFLTHSDTGLGFENASCNLSKKSGYIAIWLPDPRTRSHSETSSGGLSEEGRWNRCFPVFLRRLFLAHLLTIVRVSIPCSKSCRAMLDDIDARGSGQTTTPFSHGGQP